MVGILLLMIAVLRQGVEVEAGVHCKVEALHLSLVCNAFSLSQCQVFRPLVHAGSAGPIITAKGHTKRRFAHFLCDTKVHSLCIASPPPPQPASARVDHPPRPRTCLTPPTPSFRGAAETSRCPNRHNSATAPREPPVKPRCWKRSTPATERMRQRQARCPWSSAPSQTCLRREGRTRLRGSKPSRGGGRAGRRPLLLPPA